MKNIEVALADDHVLFREGIRMIVGQMEAINLTVEASDGQELLEKLDGAPVDVVLLDLEMKKLGGLDTLVLIRERWPDVKVIILSMHAEPQIISHLMSKGASAYLMKDATKQELEKAIREVFEKGIYFNDRTSSSLLLGLRNRNQKIHPGTQLSAREQEVLQLICAELTTMEIAEKLFISERTVEGHRKNLCSKLNVKNTAGLVKKAIALGYIGV
jgi:DNA-binding NarL/FixJ family response regulator